MRFILAMFLISLSVVKGQLLDGTIDPVLDSPELCKSNQYFD